MNIHRIIVANGEAAKDEFKKMTLNLSKPTGIKLTIFSVAQLVEKMSKIETLNENIMIIFGNTGEARQFCESYPKVKEINYGGIIKKEGAKQFSNAIFLNEEEITDAKKMKELGVLQFIQQVPTSKKENLNTMI
ncbi:PTS system mannose/fructose/sorbose transporter subunit IIB [Enterococcus ratti]|uniref:PTS system mannose/fructose/sorbose transporter subunit IIB n=1 Tax=Enterococcus ratti TaxID=150033 RepID=A0A1L8WQ89_9ENTE|nr:PTS system mannose/fructose/sorbose transporter subunit IIB [Enterococcus ratti]